MIVIFIPGKQSRLIRIRNREQLSPAHCNGLIKEAKKMFWGSFSFSVSSFAYGNWGYDEFIQIHWCNWAKSHSRYEKGISWCWRKILIGYWPVSFTWKSEDDFQEAKLNVIDWPGNSPDLNPIENLWSVRKSRLQKFDCTTMAKLIEAIIQVYHPGLRSRRWNIWLQLRPFQNFRLRHLNIKWMKCGGQEFCSN